jgi:hypothetical protein
MKRIRDRLISLEYRPPYGETNEEVLGVAASKGQTSMYAARPLSYSRTDSLFQVVTWDFDSEDSMGATVWFSVIVNHLLRF